MCCIKTKLENVLGKIMINLRGVRLQLRKKRQKMTGRKKIYYYMYATHTIFQKKKINCEEGYTTVYLDETWVDTSHTASHQ